MTTSDGRARGAVPRGACIDGTRPIAAPNKRKIICQMPTYQRVNEEEPAHGHEAFQLYDRGGRWHPTWKDSRAEQTTWKEQCTAVKPRRCQAKRQSRGRARNAPFTTMRADIPEATHLPVHSLLGDASRREAAQSHGHKAARQRGEIRGESSVL